MELLTLSLENFQGLKHEEIQLDGHSASIYGRNARGKTHQPESSPGTVGRCGAGFLSGHSAHCQRQQRKRLLDIRRQNPAAA